eukprot:6458340-Amphidinium_carterae.1
MIHHHWSSHQQTAKTQFGVYACAELGASYLCLSSPLRSSARNHARQHCLLLCWLAWLVGFDVVQPTQLLAAWLMPHVCARVVCCGGLASVLAVETGSDGAPAAVLSCAQLLLVSALSNALAFPSRYALLQ